MFLRGPGALPAVYDASNTKRLDIAKLIADNAWQVALTVPPRMQLSDQYPSLCIIFFFSPLIYKHVDTALPELDAMFDSTLLIRWTLADAAQEVRLQKVEMWCTHTFSC